MERQGQVFFSRCKPQNADPIEIVLRERRAFIGYPAWRENVAPRKGHLRDALFDFSLSDAEWKMARAQLENPSRSTQCRNFARNVHIGDVMLVPRPSLGYVYAGRVKTPFEILDDPPWGDDLAQQELIKPVTEPFSHLADIAQCCQVDEFTPIPYPVIPAWVRRSLFGRSTFGRISPLDQVNLDPFLTLTSLLCQPWRALPVWTMDAELVEKRLLDYVGPSTFEHLCVALLQLEHIDEIWEHVGGSGDGGLDGVGALVADPSTVSGKLQCKWKYDGGNPFPTDPKGGPSTRRILAIMLPDEAPDIDGLEIWRRHHVAMLVVKHAAVLPLARTMRVGTGVA